MKFEAKEQNLKGILATICTIPAIKLIEKQSTNLDSNPYIRDFPFMCIYTHLDFYNLSYIVLLTYIL